MNASLFSLIALGLCLNLVSTGTGQEQQSLPAGWSPRPPSASSAWLIAYSYGGENGAQPVQSQGSFSFAAPRQVTVIHVKPLWEAIAENIDGRKLEQWSDGVVRIFKADGNANADLVSKDTLGYLLPDYGDFPDMAWVSAATYCGVQNVGKQRCFIFKKEGMTAWIDQESRYPVKWQRGMEVRTFLQVPMPSAPVVLPPEVLRLLQSVRQDAERLQRPIPQGG